MRNKLPIIILVVMFIGYILLEVLGPKAENWNPNYSKEDKVPFGSHLVFEGLQDLFPDQSILIVEQAPSEQFVEFEESHSNFIILEQVLDMNGGDANAVLDYVKNGNTVFIAASVLNGALGDSLGLDPDDFWDLVYKEEFSKDDFLTLPPYVDSTEKHYPLLDNVYYNHFPGFVGDENLSYNRDSNITLTRMDLGEGHLYLHSIPFMFTNYFMVDSQNAEYISRVLSFLPQQKTYWDEYYKPGNVHLDTPMTFILDQTSLKWAWFLLLGTVLLFVVFEGKRRQRPIPVVEPPRNDTLEFTRTVGRLYFLHGDHKDLAEKKIKFLMEYIRNRWQLSTHEPNESFMDRLSQKSGVTLPLLENLFLAIQNIEATKKVEEETLLYLDRQIEQFYHKCR